MNIVKVDSKRRGSGCYINLDYVVEFCPEKLPGGEVEYECYGTKGECLGTIAEAELFRAAGIWT